jgi:sterol desaturase/sphingolipid hydroxylase (fatty acid hydroxylase superfamily)
MLDWLAGFLVALFVGTLIEYWGHRLMHAWLLRKRHALHHRDGDGQGWLGEFRDYVLGALPVTVCGSVAAYFIFSPEAALGFAAGGIFYGALAAYSHQLQHEKPELCFWLVRPVHYLHHANHHWHHNFGITFDFWDRVFGTYRKVEWDWQQFRGKRSFWGLFRIKWI